MVSYPISHHKSIAIALFLCYTIHYISPTIMKTIQSICNTKILTGIVLCIATLVAMSTPATAQPEGFNFAQTGNHSVNLTHATLGMRTSHIPRSFINRFNQSRTQHLFGFLYTSTRNTEETLSLTTHFVIANLGTRDQTIRSINRVEARIDHPQIGMNLPLQEVGYLSSKVCHLSRGASVNTYNLIKNSNCRMVSRTGDVVLRPGQFLLKVYQTQGRTIRINAETNPNTPFFGTSRPLRKNDVIITNAEIKVRGIGSPVRLRSIVSLGHTYLSPNPRPSWVEVSSSIGATHNGSYSSHITPLALLSSIQWLR